MFSESPTLTMIHIFIFCWVTIQINIQIKYNKSTTLIYLCKKYSFIFHRLNSTRKNLLLSKQFLSYQLFILRYNFILSDFFCIWILYFCCKREIFQTTEERISVLWIQMITNLFLFVYLLFVFYYIPILAGKKKKIIANSLLKIKVIELI